MEQVKRLAIAEVRFARLVSIGDVIMGGGRRPVVQSMTNTSTSDVERTLAQIRSAAVAGAQVMRVAVPDKQAVAALPAIVAGSPVPIVADIHFDYRLALAAIEAGVHKLRINPGNIGSRSRVKDVVYAAQEHGTAIRVGVNAGSLEPRLLKRYGGPCPEALVDSAMDNARLVEAMGFKDIVLSLKGSDVPSTVEAYRRVAGCCDYPLHIGITEAGTRWTGAIRSAVGLGVLLAMGIGDTLRVSLASDPVDEVHAAYRILEALGIERRGPTVIACPTCGRTRIDVIGLADAVEKALGIRTEPLTVAVMGCVVNGPGEAREADIGVAGGDGEGLLFRCGKPLRKVPENEIVEALVALFDEVVSESRRESRERKRSGNECNDKDTECYPSE
ncbi:flavodoxin-dependent (E)-4-hydroxy-3-methylbut-2-enyl-diphosphate synthase [bacterium]|nr:flavodoxin-dependent (E)-4-hydroxy-3-methylbut-2-enyl-diphosphate synthase [candidate division CSSED10-310 bacterium]